MVKLFIIPVVAAIMMSPGCSRNSVTDDRAANMQYMKEVLGPIILNYRDKFGRLPDSFDEAMNGTGATLSHRGDLFGRALVYVKTSSNSFYLLSYGPNGTYEKGQGDDLKAEWQSDAWIN